MLRGWLGSWAVVAVLRMSGQDTVIQTNPSLVWSYMLLIRNSFFIERLHCWTVILSRSYLEVLPRPMDSDFASEVAVDLVLADGVGSNDRNRATHFAPAFGALDRWRLRWCESTWLRSVTLDVMCFVTSASKLPWFSKHHRPTNG
jgi:hypothetical protein